MLHRPIEAFIEHISGLRSYPHHHRSMFESLKSYTVAKKRVFLE